MKLNDKKNLSFFHMNIASLALHQDELNVLFSNLEFDFDIIGLTETKITNDMPILNFSRTNYTFKHTPCEGHNGGTMLFISDKYAYTRLNDLDLLAYKSKEVESTFIELQRPGKKNMIIGCIYRHPSMSIDLFNKELFISYLLRINH